MSNDSAEKRQAFERWVSALRTDAGASPIDAGEESGVTSLEDQKTLVRNLPKDVVRKLRERESHRHASMAEVDQDSTAIFHPPPELIARARRLVPPPKPERSVPPPDPITERAALPLAAAPLDEESAAPPELSEPPLPALVDAVESELPPRMTPPAEEPLVESPLALVRPPERPSRAGWTLIVLGALVVGGITWLARTHWDSILRSLP